jgi:carbon monoxide dehydrogenase subunit G
MEIHNSFEVPLPPGEAWGVLLDIPRIVPCMPGAELTGVLDETTYTGKVSVRLGPVALSFAGQVKFESIDQVAHKARAKAQGRDTKGRGGANATVDFHLEPTASGSKVLVRTDLNLSGAVAQYGRASGVIQEVASQLIGQFAACLKQRLEASRVEQQASAALDATIPSAALLRAGGSLPDAVPPPPPEVLAPAAAKPISAVSLMLKVFWARLRRLFGAP